MQKICSVYFFCFRPENPFWINLIKKNQNCQFKLKFDEYAEFNDDATFSVFEHKYLSWVNLVQKFKIICSK